MTKKNAAETSIDEFSMPPGRGSVSDNGHYVIGRPISRRSMAVGAAWAVPALAVASAAPAFAASGDTATNVTPQAFFSEYYRVDNYCTYSGGFIDTQGSTPSGGPMNGTTPDGDGLLSTSSSIGYWLETTNTTSQQATIQSITTVFTFSKPIVIDSCPTGGYNTTGTWRWSECTTLNGWTYALSADGLTLTLTYNGPLKAMTSTSTSKSGTYIPGYFINYHLKDGCTYYSSTTISSKTTINYSSATYPTGTTWTKSTTSRAI